MPPSSAVRVFSAAIHGLDAVPIEVEVDSTPGLHFFNIVGLPDKSVEESKDRIASALKNSGFTAPSQQHRRIIVNLAPADIKKEGASYDVPIALGYLLTTGQTRFETSDVVCVGELSLGGTLRRVVGILPIAIMASHKGFRRILVPEDSIGEASIVSGIEIIGIKNLRQLVDYLENKITLSPTINRDHTEYLIETSSVKLDMSAIEGQAHAKRALLIAASGNHNILMSGPPGSGKSLLAQALPGIMPPMSRDEVLEVTKIYSIAGLTAHTPLITNRPFRIPHHTTSSAAIIGGGGIPKPGEISLAHRGVLFLDEFPEFSRSVLESLRQPLENGEVVIARAKSSMRFPARFMLVAAMNPCPCGHYGNAQKACVCSPSNIDRYQKRISGPILDRLDINVRVTSETNHFNQHVNKPNESSALRGQVIQARSVQSKRLHGSAIKTNSEMGPLEIKKYCFLDDQCDQILVIAMQKHALSMRSCHKIIKLARTIADLAQQDTIMPQHIAEALSYRIQTEEN